MKRYAINKELSKHVLDELQECIQMKECYNNVVNVLVSYVRQFKCEKWVVGYGYMPTNIRNILVRHAFVIDRVSGSVIDPTVMLQEKHERQYVVFAELVPYEYIDLIRENDDYADLKMQLLDKELLMVNQLTNEGYHCIG